MNASTTFSTYFDTIDRVWSVFDDATEWFSIMGFQTKAEADQYAASGCPDELSEDDAEAEADAEDQESLRNERDYL